MSGGSATDPGDRSSAEVERDVEDTRARLTGTLEQLRDRASPGQLFEQALDYAKRSGGTDFARNLAASVRDNPLPLLLIGAGVGWLMLSDRRGGTGGTAGDRQQRQAGEGVAQRLAGGERVALDEVGRGDQRPDQRERGGRQQRSAQSRAHGEQRML